MKSKLITNKTKITTIIILLLFITIAICGVYVFATRKRVTYAATHSTENESFELVEKNQFDIKDIIIKNINNVKREEILKKEIDLEYTTKYNNNSNLPSGVMQVVQAGEDGKQQKITKKIYEGEELVKEEVVRNIVTKSSVDKVVEIGTGGYAKKYNVKVGDELYVTTNFLAIKIEPKDESEKLITLKKNTKIKVLKIQDEWYQIKYDTYIGWSKAECFTYLNPNEKTEETEENSKYTKQQLLSKLSFDMELNKPSGLSLEQFKKIFKNEKNDTKNIFKNNAQYFYYAEKQYNVNGVFLATVAIHESGWGGSSIASSKNNLFGYGAYDRDPYNSAYEFSDYSEGIDLLARVFAKYYLNPSGTKIYDGNLADGCYYNGATLTGVNKKYATDKKWANGIYYWMNYLYNNL